MFKSLFEKIKKLIRAISQLNAAGGLVISDSALRYVKIDGGKLVRASLRLPPGIIEDGKVKDRPAVLAALKQLKDQIALSRRKKVEAVVSLENTLVYSQVFNLPPLEEKLLADAAKLNLQMISPIDIKQAYYGYQVIGQVAADGRQLEFLGAFVQANVVDEWTGALRETGWTVVAVEFQALSLIRAMDYLKVKKTVPNLSYIVLGISSEGLDFIIARNHSLYFDYFYPWRLIQRDERRISWERLTEVIISEVERVINFSSFRFNSEATCLCLISQGLNKEIIEMIKNRFPKLSVEEVALNGEKLYPGWTEALGAAVRGELPRSKDKFVSLAAVSISEEYYQGQVLNMVGLWRNIFITALSFFLVIFVLGWIFLSNINGNLKKELASARLTAEPVEFPALKKQAEDFNKLVDFIGKARKNETFLTPLLSKLEELSRANNITLTRISIQSDDQVVVNGSAPSESAVIKFKNDLASLPQISEVKLPLEFLTLDFSLSFKVKRADFR